MSEATKLEKHHNLYELKPVGKYSHRGEWYTIAEGGPFEFRFPVDDWERDMMTHYPNGFYQIAWAVLKDEKMYIEAVMPFDKNHDIDKPWGNGLRRQSRINAAKQEAIQHINDGLKTGLYGGKKETV